MGKRGPQGMLDEIKRREIFAYLTIGASQRQAAAYVGCSPGTITNTAKREPEFARRLQRAKANCEKECLRNIFHCGVKSWRASAWLLERTRPQMYEKISLRRASGKQLDNFWLESADNLLADLPSEQQELFRGRFQQAAKQFTRSLPRRRRPDDDEELLEDELPAESGGHASDQTSEQKSQQTSGQAGESDKQPSPEPFAGLSILPDDRATRRNKSCLYEQRDDVPDLATTPGFSHPYGVVEDGSEEYLARSDRVADINDRQDRDCEVMEQAARTEQQSKLAARNPWPAAEAAGAEIYCARPSSAAPSSVAPSSKSAATSAGAAIVSLLLAWLLSFACRPDFQSGQFDVPPGNVFDLGITIAGRIENPAYVASSAAFGHNLEQFPCDVPAGAFNVSVGWPVQADTIRDPLASQPPIAKRWKPHSSG